MNFSAFANRWNVDAIEAAYNQWRTDPKSVDSHWQIFFEGFELGMGRHDAHEVSSSGDPSGQVGVFRLIHAYRDVGHFIAHLDPLSEPRFTHPLLELSSFGLDESDLDRTFETPIPGMARATLRELISMLRETYCRTIGVEYMHIQDTNIRRWLQERMEPRRNHPNLPQRQKLRLLMDLSFAELFEKFLHAKYLGQKRFSLEGGETIIPIIETITQTAADMGVRELIMGMAHRGRLNVLANVLGKPYQEIFAEFNDNFIPDSVDGDGDVKYHLGFSADRMTPNGLPIHISLTPNPSHLEAVNPVVEGRARAKQTFAGDNDRTSGLPLLIHGDAAFAGQGLVAETLNLSQLTGYRTGGTIHVIINNQIGFTTAPSDARSTYYCTDVAKMIQVPIFHVNGEDPEAAAYVAQLAMEFRQTFQMDVVIDMYCYRRHGHNEGDEPSFTQPLMYSKIKDRPSISEVYTEQLILRGDLSVDAVHSLVSDFQEKLQSALAEVKSAPPEKLGMRGFGGRWQGLSRYYSDEPVDTSVNYNILKRISDKLNEVPDKFHVHSKIERLLHTRKKHFDAGGPLDWATAEALAFGTLVNEGTAVRLSGQDSRRGTFSQRHSVLYDMRTGESYTPLNHLHKNQAWFVAYDSLLSEAAVLGFEFGFSMDAPDVLTLWEAQFGDFANGAQVIIDQFIVCSSSKWQRDSGLVMLLPHGYEGQGPEHSSARLERFLQLCGEDNIQVCNLTTPAQYFHVLRRQMKRNFRKPLVIMTPKSLLRHKGAVSSVDDLVHHGFSEVIDDTSADADAVRRFILCSGKVYYDLLDAREKHSEKDKIAIVRLEQLYPFPERQLTEIFNKYKNVQTWIWAQEESANMGGWTFITQKLRELGIEFAYVCRDNSASPATGSKRIHDREQKELVEVALSGEVPHMVRATSVVMQARESSEQNNVPVGSTR